MLMAGGIHRLIADFCIYEGVGYGQRDVAWEQYDNSALLLNTDFRTGVSVRKPVAFTASDGWWYRRVL